LSRAAKNRAESATGANRKAGDAGPPGRYTQARGAAARRQKST
jgi:hypothetical protein